MGTTTTDHNSILSASTLHASSTSGGGGVFDWTLEGGPAGDAAQATVTAMDSTATLISNSSKNKSKFQFYFSWTQNTDAYLVAISLAFGLGNLLRLPRIVALNGGGLFMIVYICITLLFGIPLVFLEIGLGQFCQQGTTKLWHAVPLFKGVGFVKLVASFLMSIYYPMLMTIALFYLIWSIRGPIPFDDCPKNEEDLVTTIMSIGGQGEECLRSTILTPNQTDGPWFAVYIAFIFFIWCIFCLCLFKSISSYRLSIYFLTLPTIACLIAVLVNATKRYNSEKGIEMLTNIDWSQLLNAEVWYFATTQMFFSTHTGFGNIITCAGKMYSKTNAFMIAVSYIIINLTTGIIFVITVFLWIGSTYESNSVVLSPEIPEIFVPNLIYDASVKYIDDLQGLWASLAFLVLLLAGFISMVALLYSSILSLVQESERKIKWWHIVMAICGVGFSLGVLFILQPDIEILHMLDHYVIGRMVIASTVLELIGFSWIYGGDTLYKDFEFVLGQKLNLIWRYIWVITPIFLMAMELLSLVKLPLDGIGAKQDHEWTYAIGWSIYLTTWFIVITVGIRQINAQVDYNFTDKFLSSLKPSIDWGPVDPICRHRWKQWGDQYSLTGRRDFTLSRRGTRDYTHCVRAKASPVVMTQNMVDTSQPTSSSEHDTDQNSNEPFTINVQNGLNDNSSNGPFTLQANGIIGGRQMPKGRYWRAIH
ncbi:sodium- and chloride-dependent neutral and basic amino acid transporter B(0+)-like isoform X2 [Ischnura elegans]|uniref:sodium- and chloride-dependent neutral and basic amino acid transporter B(0+)-like isoform X2 n=1 Tax=Ischnura elegans TaxID=197161 RepID=UPI001ED8AF41|nr:sodium- and chloride-dependent neutral and basic amino acid transporter B(0+)-like isoform X2 [Ischnura elegans]